MPASAETTPSSGACARITPLLAGVVDGDIALPVEDRLHVESCLHCQAELVQYRRLLRVVRELRTSVIQPAPGLFAGILENVSERGERKAVKSMLTGRRAAYAGGLAVATVAGVTSAILLAGRARGAKTRSRRAA